MRCLLHIDPNKDIIDYVQLAAWYLPSLNYSADMQGEVERKDLAYQQSLHHLPYRSAKSELLTQQPFTMGPASNPPT